MYAYVMGLNVYWLIYTNTKLVEDSLYLGNMKNNFIKLGREIKMKLILFLHFGIKIFAFLRLMIAWSLVAVFLALPTMFGTLAHAKDYTVSFSLSFFLLGYLT